MNKIPPAVRLSLSWTLLTVSICFVAEFIGFVPYRLNDRCELRAVITESLAVQLAEIYEAGEQRFMDNTV